METLFLNALIVFESYVCLLMLLRRKQRQLQTLIKTGIDWKPFVTTNHALRNNLLEIKGNGCIDTV